MNYYKYLRSLTKDLLILSRDCVFNKKISVLMYHSIGYTNDFFNVTPEQFSWQMSYLKKNNYNVIGCQELYSIIKGGIKPRRKTVVITFDDGYLDNFTHAFPILQKFGFSSLIFIITGLIGKKRKTSASEVSMLGWREIEIMNQKGIDFQPHTVNHIKMAQASTELLDSELVESKLVLEEKLNKKCIFFAYPYGDYNSAAISAVIKNGFIMSFTVKSGRIGQNDALFEVKRNSIDSSVDRLRFILKI